MKAQRGVALITVLLVVAIVTVVCAGMIARQQLSIRGTANQAQARQAWHYGLGGEALAQSILRRDLRASSAGTGTGTGIDNGTENGNGTGQPSVDHLLEPWALPQPAYDLDEGQGQVQIRIEDLAGRFNLNSLVQEQQHNAAALAQFRRLLLRLQITEPYAERLLDWLDSDQQPSGELGAEDNAYLLLDPPYRTAGSRMEDLSELRLLLDMRDEDFQRLAPYVTALPADTPLNVNTASAMVLSSLADSLSLSAAEALVQVRQAGGFRDVASFTAQPALGGVQLEGIRLAVASQYFQATSEVRLADRRMALVSRLRREENGDVRVLQRNLGQPPRLPRQTNDGER
ncbi:MULTISPECIES: type II secretion system minor pseudopilin GspK [Pseudomonadaceae]|uniref:type II secretion system minor pseudopilin GspK n=1 Tax=Pseudomonadaceae TaxID=135621 RepID=UPI00103A70B5|nr:MULTISPECIES: type II secretion system minor pseudopilin GspK [Pseudomonadaceae]MBA1276276.1 type II secretion system minor pseudopilin GspK [Stutzerimonas stutzeri]MBC8648784.1 general secretion pathway protein GspK [Pseudomonas sp. MT4]QXY92757.1 type II secretion system minor pseudopilin GspK [Pseudomonas sp. MTM4]TCD22411.1 general secretion pathway protein GspK [Pseudomonas sp. IC_126]